MTKKSNRDGCCKHIRENGLPCFSKATSDGICIWHKHLYKKNNKYAVHKPTLNSK